jgi:hypothetical protein
MLFASAKWITRSAALLLIACTTPGQQAGQASAADTSHAREATPSHAQATQHRFLAMFARSYFPGRTGQLLIVPREGDFITRPDQDVPYMHGSPWAYDVAIPLMFVGPAVRVGTYSMPAVQQDVAPTLAAALGVHMPPTSTGRALPVLKTGMAPPRAVVLIVLDGMRRSIDRAAIPLAGHGACQLNGVPTVLASYDQRTGNWSTNPHCYRLPAYLKEVNASALWAGDAEWMHHKIDTPAAVRYSALFPAFEADAMVAMIEHEPVGEDGIADLILLNYKGADFVGHKYGPDSQELRITLGEMDRHLARVLGALEKKVANDYLLAVTADHGMPSEPSSADGRHYAPSIIDLLNNEFDPEGKQLVTAFEPENLQIFIDEDRLSKLGLTLPDLTRFLRSQPFLFWAFTSDEVRHFDGHTSLQRGLRLPSESAHP